MSIIVCCLSTACGHQTSDADSLAAAESAMSEGAYSTAQKICDRLADKTNASSLPVEMRCRMALLYMKLAEQHNESENTAAALECYRTAMADAPDSAAQAFKNLPVEDLQYAVILTTLMSFNEGDSLIINDHEMDSAYMDSGAVIH